VSFSDGSSKSVSYNSRNEADVQRAAGILDSAIAQKNANGAELTGVNGKQIRSAVEIGSPMRERSYAHQQYEHQQALDRADRIAREDSQSVFRLAIQPVDSTLSFFEDLGDGRYFSAALGLGIPKFRAGMRIAETAADGLDASRKIHGNSLEYVGDTHVYAVRGPDGYFKIGESTQGVRQADGASRRAEQQARRLQRETGERYSTRVRKDFGNKSDGRSYETKVIERYRRMFGNDKLPGNKTNR
jgi:hypothetical protein